MTLVLQLKQLGYKVVPSRVREFYPIASNRTFLKCSVSWTVCPLRETHDLPWPCLHSPAFSLSPVAMRHPSWSQGFHNSLLEEQKPKRRTKQGRPTQTSSHLTHTSHLRVFRLTYKWTIQGFSFHFYFIVLWDIWAKSHRLPQREVNGWIILHSFQYPLRGSFLIAWCWKADNQVSVGAQTRRNQSWYKLTRKNWV